MRWRSLYTLALDNSHRLDGKTHYFSYRGVEFKLVQDNPRKHADHLLTIVNSEAECGVAFKAAAEFASALAWENHSWVAIWETGYMSYSEPRTLRQSRPCMYDFPRIPFGGSVRGYGLSRLPLIETEEQRKALALFREARAANNDLLSFLLFWQVLEVRNPTGAVNFVDNEFRRHRGKLRIHGDDLAQLPLGSRSLGQYLHDDCRNAIAHLKRRPGRRALDIDDPEHRRVLTHSVRVVEGFAEHFIRSGLALAKVQYLRRLRRGAVPVYLPQDDPRGEYVGLRKAR